MELPGIPTDLLNTLQVAARDSGVRRLALVGGAVRDALLHHDHQDPWLGLPDLDLVVEGSAEVFARQLRTLCGETRVPQLQVHAAYGTVDLVLDGVKLDLASARKEHYPAPGFNPVVSSGRLEDDVARRDFTVNAMALELSFEGLDQDYILDRFEGREDLARRQLTFLHDFSVADDPTRVIRAARYAARLGFQLAPAAAIQIASTLTSWPWAWSSGDPAEQAPPALPPACAWSWSCFLNGNPGWTRWHVSSVGELWCCSIQHYSRIRVFGDG